LPSPRILPMSVVCGIMQPHFLIQSLQTAWSGSSPKASRRPLDGRDDDFDRENEFFEAVACASNKHTNGFAASKSVRSGTPAASASAPLHDSSFFLSFRRLRPSRRPSRAYRPRRPRADVRLRLLPPAHLAAWKDTLLVGDKAEFLVAFDRPAMRTRPFMFHCHILEHEEAGADGNNTCALERLENPFSSPAKRPLARRDLP
jgi:hypothetical protein